ncbi:MAG: multicopper oxidase domain-containing protein [Halobacteriales archaeon]|nr:multicopper oxidase domain-containing protein [Halobacteriales archaeon]
MRALALGFALLLLAPIALALPAPRPAAATWDVEVGPPSLPFQSLGFTPSVVQAAPGDTIVFHFHGSHTATTGLDVGTEAAEGSAPAELHLNAFDSGTVGAGNTFRVTLTEPGAYLYYCKLGNHRNMGMRALILVNG